MTNDDKPRVVTVGERGRLVVPVDLRHRLHLEPGDRVLLSEDRGGLRVESFAARVDRLTGTAPELAGAVDELLAERRAEARRENSESSRGTIGRRRTGVAAKAAARRAAARRR